MCVPIVQLPWQMPLNQFIIHPHLHMRRPPPISVTNAVYERVRVSFSAFSTAKRARRASHQTPTRRSIWPLAQGEWTRLYQCLETMPRAKRTEIVLNWVLSWLWKTTTKVLKWARPENCPNVSLKSVSEALNFVKKISRISFSFHTIFEGLPHSLHSHLSICAV